MKRSVRRPGLALYLVLHHPGDTSDSRWKNVWVGESGIAAITTKPSIAREALDEGRVFIHRCAYGSEPAKVVCEARVVKADAVDATMWLVHFETIRLVDAPPPRPAEQGLSSYSDEAP